MSTDHEHFMRVAMEEARRGGAEGNLAVGSVVGAVMKSGTGTLVLGARLRPAEFATQRFGAYSVEKLIELAQWGDRLQVVTGILSQECYEIRRDWESRSQAGT